MREDWNHILTEFGQAVSSGQEGTWRAFLQPVLRENQEEPRAFTPLGSVDERLWLYIGPGERELSPGQHLRSRNAGYTVRECTAVCFGPEVLYQRAILRREKEAAE